MPLFRVKDAIIRDRILPSTINIRNGNYVDFIFPKGFSYLTV